MNHLEKVAEKIVYDLLEEEICPIAPHIIGQENNQRGAWIALSKAVIAELKERIGE